MNYWREDQWRTSAFSTVRVTCTRCGMRFEYFAVPGVQERVGHVKASHEQDCWTELPQCPEKNNSNSKQCILAAGHPTGEQFDWFTDSYGHIWEK